MPLSGSRPGDAAVGHGPRLHVVEQLGRGAPLLAREVLDGDPERLHGVVVSREHPHPVGALAAPRRHLEQGVEFGHGGVHGAADGAAADDPEVLVGVRDRLVRHAGEPCRESRERRACGLRLDRPGAPYGHGHRSAASATSLVPGNWRASARPPSSSHDSTVIGSTVAITAYFLWVESSAGA